MKKDIIFLKTKTFKFHGKRKELILTTYLQASLNWGKKNEPVYVTEESGVVGLNFHQSKEVLIHDSTNGIGNHYDVRALLLVCSIYDI